MTVEGGEPAFPAHTHYDNGINSFPRGTPGITVRDYFAAKAMQVIINQTCINEMSEYTVRAVAKNAYLLADAMLEHRRKLDSGG